MLFSNQQPLIVCCEAQYGRLLVASFWFP